MQVGSQVHSVLTRPGVSESSAVEALYEALAARLFDAASMQARPQAKWRSWQEVACSQPGCRRRLAPLLLGVQDMLRTGAHVLTGA